eukprot:1020329-Amphidinium_carterae.1
MVRKATEWHEAYAPQQDEICKDHGTMQAPPCWHRPSKAIAPHKASKSNNIDSNLEDLVITTLLSFTDSLYANDRHKLNLASPIKINAKQSDSTMPLVAAS